MVSGFFLNWVSCQNESDFPEYLWESRMFKSDKNITAKIALGFQIRGEECVKPTSALYTQIPLTRTTIAFLERTTLKEEERQMPTDLSCCCSSCGCSRNCRQHPRLFLPLPHFSSSCMTWLLPFPFFSIVESVMALFPSTLASWVAKWGLFSASLILDVLKHAFHCFINWLHMTLYIIKRYHLRRLHH